MNKEELTQEEINEQTETTSNENETTEVKEETKKNSKFQEMLNQFVDGVTGNKEQAAKESDETTEEEINPLQEQVEKLMTEKAELSDKYLRLSAEFQNYRRRTAREKMDIIQTAGRDVIKVLLPVLDDFNRAKKAADDNDSIEAFSEGVQLVYEKLHRVLEQKGLKALETNGKVFNADFHEALTEIPAPTDDMKGKIIDTIESGYALNDKIIRYAKVVVGK
ncbi:MAG: nucleotide exchange factor GrpE [Saprospiraceae bacterium]